MDNNWQEWKERIAGYTRKIKQAEKNKISHFIPVWTAASCSCGSCSEDRGGG